MVGGADPDMTKSPRCDLHALAFRYELIFMCSGDMSYKEACKLSDRMAKGDLDDQKGN